MKKNNVVAVMLVGAFMIGAFMLYASADLMGSMNPDPYSHQDDYSLTGTIDDQMVKGTASSHPIRENGSFHNYGFDLQVEGIDFSFVLIFDSEERPYTYTLVSSDVIDGVTHKLYQTLYEGYSITIDVTDHCLVGSFSILSDSVDLIGLLIHSEVVK